MSAVAAGHCAHDWWTSFNSGLMVIEPNDEVYQEIISCIPPACKERLKKNQGFGDQDVLNFYYANWWDNQNLVLSEVYNAVTFAFEEVCSAFDYDNLKVIHYAEPPKLWQKPKWKVYAHIAKCVFQRKWNRAKMCSKYLSYLQQSRV
jgi:lipopolysaccharide biosynthesis glycosyltransferase